MNMEATITTTFYGIPPEIYNEIKYKYDGTATPREDGTYDMTINLFTTDNDKFINKVNAGTNCFIGINKRK